METMPVALFNSLEKAEPIKNRLIQAGFDALIVEKSLLQKLWFVGKEECRVRLEVPSDQFERAQKLLQEWDAAEEVLPGIIRCPECKSLRVQYPQFARHSFLTNLMLGLAAAVGVCEKDYYCEVCHFTWPKEGMRPRRKQAHLAPYYFIEGIEQTTLPAKLQHELEQRPKAA